MFKHFLPSLSIHLVDMKDRLARDSSNETLKNLFKISEDILRYHYQDQPEFKEVSILAASELSSCEDSDKDIFITQYPMFKAELTYYFTNKKNIDTLKVYIESSSVVMKVSNDFFKSMDNK